MIMPAFLPASDVGLYAVAGAVASTVVGLAGAMVPMVLPSSARNGGGRGEEVFALAKVTIAIGASLALAVWIAATPLIELVYGAEFAGAADAARLLVGGAALYACGQVFSAGTAGRNRPFTAFLPEGLGMIITVVGLALFLRGGGIEAAATVSLVAYSVVCAGAAGLFLMVVRSEKRSRDREEARLVAKG
jgi:O-antigen/teichoic acid export membrane protein